MIDLKSIEKEVSLEQEIELTLASRKEKKEYFSNININKYRKEKKKNFKNLIFSFEKFILFQEDLYLFTKNRVNEYNAYDSDQWFMCFHLNLLTNVFTKKQEEFFLINKNYYDETNELEKDEFTTLYNQYLTLFEIMIVNQKKLISFMNINKYKEVFIESIGLKIHRFLDKRFLYQKFYPHRIGNYFSESENETIDKTEIIEHMTRLEGLYYSFYEYHYRYMSEAEDFITFKQSSIAIIKMSIFLRTDGIDKTYNTGFESDKKSKIVVRKFTSKYNKNFNVNI